MRTDAVDDQREPDDADTDVAIDDEGDDDAPIPPPEPRPRVARRENPTHRQPRVKASVAPSGTSSWLDRPREGFTAAMETEAPRMLASREARHVKGIPVDR